jgi:hypothetical protein
MTHHPHVHMIVPGGGISLDGSRWVSCRPSFFLSVQVLSRLFRGLFLAKLRAAHQAGRLKFFGTHAHLDDAQAFKAYLAPLRKIEWVVYAKRPFGGPQAVLAYLSRYTHRVGLPPHPSLRAACQWQPCHQHRAGTQVARRAIPLRATRHVRGHRARRTARAATSVPLLRWPHDHHRDLRARLRAEAPPHACADRDQDRHLMMPSPSVKDGSDARHSCRLSAGSAPACVGPPDRPAVAQQIFRRNV